MVALVNTRNPLSLHGYRVRTSGRGPSCLPAGRSADQSSFHHSPIIRSRVCDGPVCYCTDRPRYDGICMRILPCPGSLFVVVSQRVRSVRRALLKRAVHVPRSSREPGQRVRHAAVPTRRPDPRSTPRQRGGHRRIYHQEEGILCIAIPVPMPVGVPGARS